MLLHEIFPGELLPTEATRKGDCTMQLQVPGEIVTGDLDKAGGTNPSLFHNSHFLLQMRGRICGGGGRTWSGLSDGSIG